MIMRAMLLLVLVTGVALSAASQRPAPPPRPDVPPSRPTLPPTRPDLPPAPDLPPLTPLPVWTPPAPPADVPRRLQAAQELAWAAYPELRARALQLRVDEAAAGPTVTFGFIERDRADVLGLSRPREAQLVVDATFGADEALTTAVLRGPLARTAERRQAHGGGARVGDRLDADGAAFGPGKRAVFLQQLDLGSLGKVAGQLTMDRAQFQLGAAADGVYWEVAATSPTGPVTLGFEPYAGRLVRFAKGGGR